MTIKKFYTVLILQALAIVGLQFVFFTQFDYASSAQQVLYYSALVILVIIFTRALGVISFIEWLIASIFWVLLDLLINVVFLSTILGSWVFSQQFLWAGYLLVLPSVMFLAHKKRHLHLRKELHAKAHGHSHGHGHAPGHGKEQKH